MLGPPPAEISLDKPFQVAVQNALDVPHLVIRPEILHHLIGLEDV
jgi:hypothetical protein